MSEQRPEQQSLFAAQVAEVRWQVPAGSVHVPELQLAVQHIDGVEQVAPVAPRPLFGRPSQLLSTPLQVSLAPGWTVASVSLQSVPRPTHPASAKPSWSRSHAVYVHDASAFEHTSVVHARPSSQSTAVPATHTPGVLVVELHRSTPLQNWPSSQRLAVGPVQARPGWQPLAVHTLPLVHSVESYV